MERREPIDGKSLVPLDEDGSDERMDPDVLARVRGAEPKPHEEVEAYEL